MPISSFYYYIQAGQIIPDHATEDDGTDANYYIQAGQIIPLYSPSFSSKQNTSASVPKSLPPV